MEKTASKDQMYGPWGSFPLDIWTIILSYLDFTTLYTFTKVHPRFITLARFAYLAKRKRRPDYTQISVRKITFLFFVRLSVLTIFFCQHPKKKIFTNDNIAFDIRGSTLYLVQVFSGASIWSKESRVSSWRYFILIHHRGIVLPKLACQSFRNASELIRGIK